MYQGEMLQIPKVHSNLSVENKLTTPWLKKKQTNIQIKVHRTQLTSTED